MNRIAAGFLTLILGPSLVSAWEIARFDADIRILDDGSVSVHEIIEVDFYSGEKHGIFRDLPLMYEGPEDAYSEITDITVLQDGSDAIVDTEASRRAVLLRIGDPGTAIEGLHRYDIRYRVAGVMRAFDGYDELYWNVTGNGWDVPIRTAHATVTAPAAIVQASCYRGIRGSTDPCEQRLASTSASFATEELGAYEGLTIAAGIPSGTVPLITITPPPSAWDVLHQPMTLLIAAICGIAGIFGILYVWWHYGRDRFWRRSILPGVRSDREKLPESILPLFNSAPVSVEYDAPDELRPAEIGVLMDERADTLDVSATIVDLASRGYLEITEVKKAWLFGSTDYVFTRTAKKDENLRSYEHLLLESLFDGHESVTMSTLKNSFYTDLAKVKQALYDEVVARKLFPSSPARVRGIYFGISAAILAVSVGIIMLAVALAPQYLAMPSVLHGLFGVGLAGCMSALILLVMSPFMSRRSAYGRELYQRSLGYEMFVSGTEKHRARFYEDTNLFTAVLPYAIVFGVTDTLARAFKEMGVNPPAPAWYHGSGTFNPAVFATSMDSFSASVGSAMASAPSGSGSGSGGSSGGGFGGGGGGSW